jgi:hypothetical protein
MARAGGKQGREKCGVREGKQARDLKRSGGAMPKRSGDGARKNPEGDDLLYDAKGIDISVHAKIRRLVKRKPLLVELAETEFVAEKRPIIDLSAAVKQFVDRTLKPDKGRVMLAQKRDVMRLSHSPATEGNNSRLLLFGGFGESALELFVFDTAKLGFAHARKNVGDREPGGFRDPLIEIDGGPAGLAAKELSDR